MMTKRASWRLRAAGRACAPRRPEALRNAGAAAFGGAAVARDDRAVPCVAVRPRRASRNVAPALAPGDRRRAVRNATASPTGNIAPPRRVAGGAGDLRGGEERSARGERAGRRPARDLFMLAANV